MTRESELITRAQAGERAAREDLVRQYSPMVFRLISRFFRYREDVEDLAQDVFLKVFRGIGQVRPDENFGGWLRIVTVNTCYDTLRRMQRRKAAVDRARRRWGSLIANAKAAEDLKVHARRVAHLQRIRAVATAKKDKKTVEAVDELLTKEDERHSKTMNSLREGALPGNQ